MEPKSKHTIVCVYVHILHVAWKLLYQVCSALMSRLCLTYIRPHVGFPTYSIILALVKFQILKHFRFSDQRHSLCVLILVCIPIYNYLYLF